MIDLTTLDAKIAGTTKSVHCFPPNIEKFKIAAVKHLFGYRIAKNDQIFLILVSKPMFMRSRNSINYVLNILQISFNIKKRQKLFKTAKNQIQTSSDGKYIGDVIR